MAIYAISDLHLSFGVDKPMNIFGTIWKDYEKKIEKNWKDTVNNNDIVIIPGDISWGINLKETLLDFKFINELPGNKIIMKGNHDYYFSTKTKLENFFKENGINTISILHNNAIDIGEYILCGTRGWSKIESNDKKLDKKIIERESKRLILSLEEGIKLQNGNQTKKEILVAMHFPPFLNEFQMVLKEYNVKKCIYGHLHGYGHCMIKEGIIDNIEYIMVSCDYTKFKLVKL